MFGKQPKFKYIFLFLDYNILSISLVLSIAHIYQRFSLKETCLYRTIFSSLQIYLILLLIPLICFLYNDLYKRDVIVTIYRQTILVIKSLLFGGMISAGILFVSYNFRLMTFQFRDIVFLYLLYSFIMLLIFRVFAARWLFLFLAKKRILHSRVLIIGGDEAAKNIGKSLENSRFSDFVIVGFIDDRKPVDEIIYGDYKNLGTLDTIGDIVSGTKADEILISIDDLTYERLIGIVEKCLQTGKIVRIYSNLLRVIAEKLKVEFYVDIPVVMLSQRPLSGINWIIKRILDIVMSFIALTILSPLFLVISIGIKLSSPRGPIFFKQTRAGRNGRSFKFYKFRSMHTGKSDEKHKEFVQDFIKSNEECKQKDIRIFKITDDHRIFKFGKFIRKTSIDEFPQFYNVLKGDMSLVGPRPCLPYEWECYSEWHKNRLNVFPGCTGLWQAVGRSTVTFEEMVILDLYYISNMSLWLDFKIMMRTIPVIFFAKGAH